MDSLVIDEEVCDMFYEVGSLLARKEKWKNGRANRMKTELLELRAELMEQNAIIYQMAAEIDEKNRIIQQKDQIILLKNEKLMEQEAIISSTDEKLKLVEANNDQVTERLKEKQEIISRHELEMDQKNIFIIELDELLMENSNAITEKESILIIQQDLQKQYEVTIAQLKFDICELEDIIDEKELMIVRNGEFIEEKIEETKQYEAETDNIISGMNAYIQQLEESIEQMRKERAINIQNRKPCEAVTMYDHLKISYHNCMNRCNELEKLNKKNGELIKAYKADNYCSQLSGARILFAENVKVSSAVDHNEPVADCLSFSRISTELIDMLDSDSMKAARHYGVLDVKIEEKQHKIMKKPKKATNKNPLKYSNKENIQFLKPTKMVF